MIFRSFFSLVWGEFRFHATQRGLTNTNTLKEIVAEWDPGERRRGLVWWVGKGRSQLWDRPQGEVIWEWVYVGVLRVFLNIPKAPSSGRTKKPTAPSQPHKEKKARRETERTREFSPQPVHSVASCTHSIQCVDFVRGGWGAAIHSDVACA